MAHIILKGNPISTQNAYGQHKKIRYMKKEAKEMKDSYVLQAKMQYKDKPLEGPLSIFISLYFKDKRVRDWDNWHKISMDALTGIVWTDDSQIRIATVDMIHSYDKENPRIDILIDKIPA